MSKHKIFVLEGLGGVGKTTVGKLLAEKSGAKYLHAKHGNPVYFMHNLFEALPVSVSYLYYVVFFTFSYLKTMQYSRASDVILDRSIYYILADSKVLNISNFFLKLTPKYIFSSIDRVIYLMLDEGTRQGRIAGREKISNRDQRMLKTGEKLDAEYKNILPKNTLYVATDDKSPEQVVDEIINSIELSKPNE